MATEPTCSFAPCHPAALKHRHPRGSPDLASSEPNTPDSSTENTRNKEAERVTCRETAMEFVSPAPTQLVKRLSRGLPPAPHLGNAGHHPWHGRAGRYPEAGVITGLEHPSPRPRNQVPLGAVAETLLPPDFVPRKPSYLELLPIQSG